MMIGLLLLIAALGGFALGFWKGARFWIQRGHAIGYRRGWREGASAAWEFAKHE